MKIKIFLCLSICICLTLQGCVGLMFDAAMESVGIADWRSITIDQSPSLTESSPLSSVSPQKICVMKFEDTRGVNRENKVGSLMTYRPGTGMGTAPIVAENIASVPSLVALLIENELKRNSHTISADGEPCDFAITGAVKEFWINTPSLNIPGSKKKGVGGGDSRCPGCCSP